MRTLVETVTLLGPEANQFVLHDRDGNSTSPGGWAYWIDAVYLGAIIAMDDPQTPTTDASCSLLKCPATEGYIQGTGPVVERALAAWPDGCGYSRGRWRSRSTSRRRCSWARRSAPWPTA